MLTVHVAALMCIGTPRLREAIDSGATADEIESLFVDEAAAFAQWRQPFLLYK